MRLNVHNADENGAKKPGSRIVLDSHQMQTVIHHHLMLRVIQKLALMKILKIESYDIYCNMYLLKLMGLRRTMYIIS